MIFIFTFRTKWKRNDDFKKLVDAEEHAGGSVQRSEVRVNCKTRASSREAHYGGQAHPTHRTGHRDPGLRLDSVQVSGYRAASESSDLRSCLESFF